MRLEHDSCSPWLEANIEAVGKYLSVDLIEKFEVYGIVGFFYELPRS